MNSSNMGRKKKSNAEQSSLTPPEVNLNFEIEIQALRGKNKELAQNVAKLQQDRSLLQKQINSLQHEYFSLNSKYVNLKNVFSTIDTTIKSICFPKVAEVVQHLSKVMHLCAVGSAVSNTNRDPKTQTVSPHTVNGTVIKNPIITLARFSDVDTADSSSRTLTSPRLSRDELNLPVNYNSGISPQRRQSLSPNVHQDPRPSTSRGFSESVDERGSSENEDSDSEDGIFHRRRPVAPLDSSPESDLESENNMETNEAEDEENREEYCSRLITIDEGDEEQNSSMNSDYTDRVREIRIYLSPLHDDFHLTHCKDSPDRCTARTSLSDEPSDTFLENNTVLNESAKSPNRTLSFVNNFSLSRNKRQSDGFVLEDSDFWKKQLQNNNVTDSFSFSSIPSATNSPHVDSLGGSPSRMSVNLNDTYNSKILTMTSLGLKPSCGVSFSSSTPVVSSPRKRTRNCRKIIDSPDTTMNSKATRSNISKRKTSVEANTAQVVIKRLNIDKSISPVAKLGEYLGKSPITSIKGVKKRKKLGEETPETELAEPETNTNQRKTNKKGKEKAKENNKGKENKVKIQSTIQKTKSSPRPTRAARPNVLREPSLLKKMRRSR